MKINAALEAFTGRAAPAWNEGPIGQVAPLFRAAWEASEQQRLAQADARADALSSITLDVLRRRLAHAQDLDLSKSTAPAIARIDAWRHTRAARSGSDPGVEKLAAYLQYLWQQDPQGVLTVADCAGIRTNFAQCYPRSAAAPLIDDAVAKVGALSLPLREIARIASTVQGDTEQRRQASYEETIRAYGLGGTAPEKIRIRTFIRALAQTDSPTGVSLPETSTPHDEASEQISQVNSPNTGQALSLELGVARPGLEGQPGSGTMPGMNDVAPLDPSVPVPQNGAMRGASVPRRGQMTPATGEEPVSPDGMAIPPPSEDAVEPGVSSATITDPSDPEQQLRVELHTVNSPMDGEPGGPSPQAPAGGGSMQTGMGAFASYAVTGGAVATEPLEVIAASTLDEALGVVAMHLGEHGQGARVIRRSALVAYVALDQARGEGVRVAAVLPGRKGAELPASARTAAEWLDQEGFAPTDVLCSIADGVLSGEDDSQDVEDGMKGDIDTAKKDHGVEDMMGSQEGDPTAEADLDTLLEEAKSQIGAFFDGLRDAISKEGFRDPRIAAVRSTAGLTAVDVERVVLGGKPLEQFGVSIAANAQAEVEVRTANHFQKWPLTSLDAAILDWQGRVAMRLPPPRTMRGQVSAERVFLADLPAIARSRPELAQRIVAALSSAVPGTNSEVQTDGRLRIAMSDDAGALARVRRVLADRFGVLTLVAAPVLNPMGQPIQHAPPVMPTELVSPDSGTIGGGPNPQKKLEDAVKPPATTPGSMGMGAVAAYDEGGLYRVAYRIETGQLLSLIVEAADRQIAAHLVRTNLGNVAILSVEPAGAYTPPPPAPRQAQMPVPRRAQHAPHAGPGPAMPGLEAGPPPGGGSSLPGMAPSAPMLGLDTVEISEQDRDQIRAGLMHYRATNHTIGTAIVAFLKEYKSFTERFGEENSPQRQVLDGVIVQVAQDVWSQPAMPIVAAQGARPAHAATSPSARIGMPGAPRSAAGIAGPGKVKPQVPGSVSVPKMPGDTSQTVPRALDPRVNRPGAGGDVVRPPSPALGKDSDNVDIGRFKAPKPKSNGTVNFTGKGWGSETKLPPDLEQVVPKVLNSSGPKVK